VLDCRNLHFDWDHCFDFLCTLKGESYA